MDNKLKYRLASPLLMWVIVVVGGIILWRAVPKGYLFYSGMLGVVALVLGLADWIYVMVRAASVHRRAPRSVHNIDELVTEGVYAVVRHPIYAADIALAWCAFIFRPTYAVLAVVAWLTVVLLFWAGFEERMLEDKFLEDYREYKKRVPMMIPRFGRRQIK